jgi:hypothetical protein
MAANVDSRILPPIDVVNFELVGVDLVVVLLLVRGVVFRCDNVLDLDVLPSVGVDRFCTT